MHYVNIKLKLLGMGPKISISAEAVEKGSSPITFLQTLPSLICLKVTYN
jgi:hypothetical protein